MERSFYNEGFEELIKQKADQYKMYPSDNVWKGIHGSLHPRRKWYWFGFFLILSGAGFYTFDVLLIPSPAKQIAKAPAVPVNHPDPDGHISQAIIIPFSTPVKKNGPAVNTSSTSTTDEAQADNTVHIPLLTDNSTLPAPENNDQAGLTADAGEALQDQPVKNTSIRFPVTQNNIQIKAPPAGMRSVITDKAAREDAHQATTWDHYAPFEFNLPALKRLSWQLSFSPTKNYRKLQAGGNTGVSDVKNVPVALNIPGNPNDLLNHDPALGFELGTHLLYAVNRNLRLKVGVQFNYSRYNIQAYSSYSIERATIALNNPYGYSGDSLTSYTRLQNFGGDAVQKLHNQYFQLSTPIGAELRVLGERKLQFHIAGTLQPTYLLNRNTYLITTDYKNYTEAPSLVRRWNLNTGIEAFASYQAAGGLRWQIGPQFRYQLFSSYVSEYPIREHLMEYGIRLAVSKVIR